MGSKQQFIQILNSHEIKHGTQNLFNISLYQNNSEVVNKATEDIHYIFKKAALKAKLGKTKKPHHPNGQQKNL